MVTEDQSEVVAFLASPSTHGGSLVECIETHASMVFLAAARAWKLKRAVRYGLLIGNTAERVLRKLSGSVLAVKPDGFVSPVRLRHVARIEAPSYRT